MEDDVVVVVLLGEADKVLDRLRDQLGEQVDRDVALCGVDHGAVPGRASVGRCRGGDGELVPGWLLVEDVAVSGLLVGVLPREDVEPRSLEGRAEQRGVALVLVGQEGVLTRRHSLQRIGSA